MFQNATLKNSLFITFLCVLAACGQTPVEQKELHSTSKIPAPTNLTGSATSTQISLNWTNPNYEGDYFIRVQHRPVGGEFEVDATLDHQSEYQISDLETLKDHEVRLQAITKDGETSTYSESITLSTILRKGYIGDQEIVLPFVQNISVIYTSVNAIKITWDWSDSDISGIESYDIYRKQDADKNWNYVSSSDSIVPTPQVNDTPDALTVAYRIKVHYRDDANSIANFDSGFVDYLLPGVTGLTASYNSYNSATLMWDWSSRDTSSVAYYEIYKQKYNDGNWVFVSKQTSIAKTYTDRNVQATTVKYRIAVTYGDADNTKKNFDMASSINFDLPDATWLEASFVNINSVTFSWKWSSEDTSSIKSYDVYRQSNNDGNWNRITSTSIITIGTSYSDTNPQTTVVKYRLAVHYNDAKATTTNFDMTSSEPYALPQPSTPVAAFVIDQIKLTWSWSNRTHYDALLNYKIQRSPASGTVSWTTLDTVISVNPPAIIYFDDSVASDDYTNFIYRIEVAYKSGGKTFDSAPATAQDGQRL